MNHEERCVLTMRVFTVALALIAVGCRSTGDEALQDTAQNASDTAASQGNSSVASGDTTTAETRGRKTPAMLKPFHRMDDNEFEQYVRGLQFAESAGRERPRQCVTGAGAACRIFIAPEIGAESVTPTNLDSSYVIGRLVNRGTIMEKRYSIPGGDTAYWVVEPGKAAITRMIVIRNNGTSYELGGSPYPYDTCARHTRRPLQADMRGCHPHPTTPGIVDDPALDAAAWVSCLAGCCTG